MGCGASSGDGKTFPANGNKDGEVSIMPVEGTLKDKIIADKVAPVTVNVAPAPAKVAAGVPGQVSANGDCASKFDDILREEVALGHITTEASAGSLSPAAKAKLQAQKLLEESTTSDVEKVARTLTKDPHLLILYTGGTVGMMQTDSGYAPKKGYLPQRMSELPTFQDLEKPKGTMPKSLYGRHTTYVIQEYSPLLDSSSMSQKDWIRIAKDIEKEYNNYDGFIVLHGTDTMAHTASALSFMLENLAKPVVVTGSQIPLSELRNDGVENLLGSMLVAGHFAIPEVLLFFRSRLMRGNRTWKESSHCLDGFSSPNLGPLAQIAIGIDVDWDNVLPMPTRPLVCHSDLVTDIAVVTLFPGVSPVLVRSQLAPPVAGAVLQTFGAGNAPEDEDLLDVLNEASQRGVLMVNVTQCRHGGVAVGAYAASAGLVKAKVVSLRDITLEAALAKMCVVLGKGLPLELARRAMEMNFAGEMCSGPGDNQVVSLSSAAFIRAVAKALGTFGTESRAQIQSVLLPLMACSAAGNGDVTELSGIFRVGESPDCCDYDSRAPLHVAAAGGHLDCVKFLLEEKGAKVNITDRWGGVPLDDACLNGHSTVCDVLLSQGARPSQALVDKLPEYVSKGNIEMVKLMIKCQVDVNTADYDGRTSLMLAASRTIEMVKLLLDAKADVSKQDRWKHSAADEATDPAIKAVLEEAAAQAIIDSVDA